MKNFQVFASLANVLGRVDNMPSLIPPELSEMQLEDVEIRQGFLQIAEALSFLHNDAKILHRNICPESILINKTGNWKLAGFDFCAQNSAAPGSPVFFKIFDFYLNFFQ